MKDKKKIKDFVRESYAEIARKGGSCCSGSCCGGSAGSKSISKSVGYSDTEMSAVPDGANLGLGCGNPVALASLKEGETVLDLGAGAGFDAFLASQRVGATGKVIGVDMTPEMVERARTNADMAGFRNVEFRLGEIERLPVEASSVDAIISNCVINLSVDKPAVFKEAFRVLKRGGRLMVSDLVLLKKLPAKIMRSLEAYAGCLAGAIKKDEYLQCITAAGFKDVKIIGESRYPVDALFDGLMGAQDAIVSIKVSAVKR